MPPGFGWVGGNEGGRRHFEKMCAWACAFGKRFLAVRDDGVGVACSVVGGNSGLSGEGGRQVDFARFAWLEIRIGNLHSIGFGEWSKS